MFSWLPWLLLWPVNDETVFGENLCIVHRISLILVKTHVLTLVCIMKITLKLRLDDGHARLSLENVFHLFPRLGHLIRRLFFILSDHLFHVFSVKNLLF